MASEEEEGGEEEEGDLEDCSDEEGFEGEEDRNQVQEGKQGDRISFPVPEVKNITKSAEK